MKLKLLLLIVGLGMSEMVIGAILSKKIEVALIEKYVIGHRSVTSQDFQAFLDTSLLSVEQINSAEPTTFAVAITVNDAHSYKKDRKVGLTLSMDGQHIMANFTAQKKTWLGWIRYSTTYHGNFYIVGAGFEFAQGDVLGMYPSYVNMNGRSFGINTIERDGNYITRFGRKTAAGSCSGDMEIWSRGIIYSDRGIASIGL